MGAEISPAQTLVVGALPAKPLTTSVPPLLDATCTQGPMASWTHR
jgi:hypothetical protein